MTDISAKPRQAAPLRTLLPILVLYNTKLEGSTTYQTFVASSCHAGLDAASIAVYDNSPIPQVNSTEEAHLFAYKHDLSNSGIAAAYNWALDTAQSHGFPWLLLLDQDTALPPEFLDLCLMQIAEYETNTNVVAIVPVARSGGRVISPKRVGFLGLKPLPASSLGIQSAEIMAINSGAVIRCDFVRSIGGFNRVYRLDFLDHWLFRQVYASNREAVVSRCTLEHNLSVQDYQHSVSVDRYRSILAGEAGFITTYKSRAYIPFYLCHLLGRSIKMVILRRPDIALLTIAMIFRIILHPISFLEGRSE